MKIKDFVHSAKKVNKTPSKFILSNESKESHLEHQIKELQIELNRLSEVDEKNEDLTQRASTYNSNEKSRIQEITSLRNEKRMVEEEIERLRKFERDNHSLTTQVKNISAEVNNCKGTLELAKNNSIEKDKTLLNLQQRFDVLFKEEAGIRSELNQTQNKYQSQKVELSKYSKIYNETKDLLGITQGTLQDATKEVLHSKDEEVFWKNRTTSLEQEVAQLKDVENNLRKWSSNLTEDSAKTSGMNKMKTKKLTEAQNTIAEMGDVINNLVKEIKYVREQNSKLQYEVSRPRYASMGAIARNEGFVMPMGKENIRTKFLGNSSPKLLKFKEKRNDN